MGTRRATPASARWRGPWPTRIGAPGLVARYGGEELAVILPGATRESLAALAENVRLRVLDLALPHLGSTVAPFVTVSVGVACAELGDDVLPEALVAAADRALYLAKQRGRNRVEVHLEVSGSLSRLSRLFR